MEQTFQILCLNWNEVISKNELESIMRGIAMPEIVWWLIINEVDMNHDREVINNLSRNFKFYLFEQIHFGNIILIILSIKYILI